MRIEIMDRIAFSVVSNTCVKELVKVHPKWDSRAIKRNARPRFKKMLKETPPIGSNRQNCMKINLVGGIVWFAIYEAVEKQYGRMSDELYSKMCNATYTIPMMARKFRNIQFFSAEFQERYAKKIDKANRFKSEYNWTSDYGKGAPDFSTMRFTTCGLCALAIRTGHLDILPIMCRTDYTVASMIGANLHRNKTLATGDPICDYLYTRPGSEIEKQWQAEHPEGTFNSK